MGGEIGVKFVILNPSVLVYFIISNNIGLSVSKLSRNADDILPSRGVHHIVDNVGDRIGLFAAIDETRFKRVVVPGDTLRLEVTMEKLGSRFGRGRGVASVDGEVACEATLSFIIPPDGILR